MYSHQPRGDDPCSDPEKTVLDLAIEGTLRAGDLVALLLEYGSSCDRDVIVRYLERCLPTFKALVEAFYES